MAILVIGGAGYIGSHVVKQLVAAKENVIVVDNLATGHLQALAPEVTFYQGDVRDREFLQTVFQQEKIESVFHFAASSLVGESIENPLKYFDNNVFGMQVLLETMKKNQVQQLVFSSSAAVYGEPEEVPISEQALTNPTNPYGESKLMMEKMIKWCHKAYGIQYVALRYFNVAGAAIDGTIGEDHHPETHLIPLVLQVALGQREQLAIYGDDYDTPDGTCIRDYVHVEDLAAAHLLALKYLKKGNPSTVFNLGSNHGYSVKEILDAARKVTQKPIPAVVEKRRAGDPSKLVASHEKAQELLGWHARYEDLETIIGTAWKWHQSHPKGYQKEDETWKK